MHFLFHFCLFCRSKHIRPTTVRQVIYGKKINSKRTQCCVECPAECTGGSRSHYSRPTFALDSCFAAEWAEFVRRTSDDWTEMSALRWFSNKHLGRMERSDHPLSFRPYSIWPLLSDYHPSPRVYRVQPHSPECRPSRPSSPATGAPIPMPAISGPLLCRLAG